MRLVRLDRAVLRLGKGAVAFLKAYATNTPDKPRSAFLDAHGKIVAVFDQALLAGDEALLAVERPFVRRVYTHLEKYLDLTGVSLTNEARFEAFFDLDGEYSAGEKEVVLPQPAGLIVLTTKNPPAVVSEEEFRLFRLTRRVPLQGIDYDGEMLLNVFDDEDRVSYSKGCYLGQEIIARVHYRARPPKHLEVRAEEDCDTEARLRMTSKARDPRTGRTLGFVFTENV
jgi:hypothetical protein